MTNVKGRRIKIRPCLSVIVVLFFFLSLFRSPFMLQILQVPVIRR
uniref:Uncharacterized protein n=1 Tax=Nelumbo nucifera TaxID=4432 RepID=A0A822XEQ7_NELNU|nr:TPA_asm: hypothetical protein HUJ06_020273 [Nelumbo nucifera]